MSLLDAMRENPGLRIRCRWVENPADRCPRHGKGGWGFHGVGPVLATTAEVRALYESGVLRCVNAWPENAHLQRLEWMEFMLAGKEQP